MMDWGGGGFLGFEIWGGGVWVFYLGRVFFGGKIFLSGEKGRIIKGVGGGGGLFAGCNIGGV